MECSRLFQERRMAHQESYLLKRIVKLAIWFEPDHHNIPDDVKSGKIEPANYVHSTFLRPIDLLFQSFYQKVKVLGQYRTLLKESCVGKCMSD